VRHRENSMAKTTFSLAFLLPWQSVRHGNVYASLHLKSSWSHHRADLVWKFHDLICNHFPVISLTNKQQSYEHMQPKTVPHRLLRAKYVHYIATHCTVGSSCYIIFYRAMRMDSANYVVARCLTDCPSVRLSHAGIVSKRLHISSNWFNLR